MNPYKFGMVGSTDAHTGLAAMEEDNFFGKTTPQEPSPERMTATFMNNPKTGVKIMDWEVGASGYAAVWATENTRESILDAMQRKETYATTGPRMVVRFFGGWDFETSRRRQPHARRSRLRQGRADGRRPAALRPQGKAPTFLVAALKDPIGANLDRIQIIKGWLDAKGEVHEKIYDVVWGGDRKPDADGKLPQRRQHRGRRERDLDQHHRRARADRRLERPGLRRQAARLLLRPRHRDSHAALDRLRRETLRRQAAARHAR